MIELDKTRIAEQLGISPTASGFAAIVNAVTTMVGRWIPEKEHTASDTILGCEMLAARLWRRRSSPSGVESLGELGTVYVARYDPDIAILLGLGSHARPMVG